MINARCQIFATQKITVGEKLLNGLKNQSASRQMNAATLTFDEYFYAYIKRKSTRVAIQDKKKFTVLKHT